MSSLAALQGCGDDEEDTGGGGKGGTSGAAGEAGDGGTAGSTTGGRGGSAGSGATGGTGGATGGSGPTGGTSGAAGAPGGAGGAGGEGGGPPEDRMSVCSEYCQLYQDKDCELSDANTYEGANPEQTCRDTCNAADWELGERGAASGNTVHCRLTHAGLAAAPSPGPDQLHCDHASAEPSEVCVD
jgi:hypothetical protein